MSQNPVQSLWAAFSADAQRRGEPIACQQLLERAEARALGAEQCRDFARTLLQNGFAATAASLLGAAIERPDATEELRYWCGNALRMSGQFEHAEAQLRGVLQRDPAHRDAAYSLAHMLREQGRMHASADVMTALARVQQDDRDIVVAVLRFLCECGSFTAAREIASLAATKWPRDGAVLALVGEIELALAAFAEARDHFRQALDRDRAQSTAWLRLAQCQRYTRIDDDDISRFRAASADTALDRIARTCAGFALGKALDDLGAFAEAAAVLCAANATAALDAPWDAGAWRRLIDDQIAARPLPSVETDPGFVPIFIVGLPRSGTTLLATRLAAHAQISDRGELPWIAAMHDHLRSQRLLRDPQALRRVAQLVAVQMRRDDMPAPRYVIDKNPLNFRHLNFVRALFPNAFVIHCRRSPRDTALSIWQQHFAHEDLAFSYDFDRIAQVSSGYERLMQHWQATLKLVSTQVHYETLVGDLDGECQRIARLLQLDEARIASADPAHAIATASVWQARQPVHDRSVGRWRNYAPFVPELEALFPV